MGADRLVEALIGHPDADIADHHTELHLARRDEIRPLPGARDLVRGLHDRGARPVLASSASDEELDAVRSILEVDEWVAGHTTSADVEHSKPSPDIFAAALEAVGVAPDRAVAVGDTVWDAEAALALSLPFVGLETGGARRSELVEAGASAVLTDPHDLVAAVEDGLIARLLAAGPD
jgi:HAD superfamily hydrolase (TIGR01509 family)